MIENSVEILLVEDNPADVELTLDTLKVNKLTNNIHVVRDGFAAVTPGLNGVYIGYPPCNR